MVCPELQAICIQAEFNTQAAYLSTFTHQIDGGPPWPVWRAIQVPQENPENASLTYLTQKV